MRVKATITRLTLSEIVPTVAIAEKVLHALRIGLMLIHPQETNRILAKYRCELEEAEQIQELLVSQLQRGNASGKP